MDKSYVISVVGAIVSILLLSYYKSLQKAHSETALETGIIVLVLMAVVYLLIAYLISKNATSGTKIFAPLLVFSGLFFIGLLFFERFFLFMLLLFVLCFGLLVGFAYVFYLTKNSRMLNWVLLIVIIIILLFIANILGMFQSLNQTASDLIAGPPDKSCAIDSDCELKSDRCGGSLDAVNKEWNRFCPFYSSGCKYCMVEPYSPTNYTIACVQNECVFRDHEREYMDMLKEEYIREMKEAR